jgi:general secretion pathway protein A
MLEQAFGLREAPFSVTPDPKFVYLSPRHKNALAGLTFAILSRKRFVLLTGDVGTGKTTLITTALEHLPPQRTRFSVILNPTLSASEILEAVLHAFGIQNISHSKVQRLAALEQLLKRDDQQGRISTLIVDEAHKLRLEALEEIRLLGNLASLQIVLVGQNELIDVLNHPELRPLKQRIALRLSIEPLSPPEVGQYITHRWSKAGGRLPPFSREAVAAIARHSRGIPRLINTICDNALMLALQEQVSTVSVRHVVEAAAGLDVTEPRAPEVAGPRIVEPENHAPPARKTSTLSRLLVRKAEP